MQIDLLFRAIQPEYELVAASWSKSQRPGRLHFAVLDFMAGQDVFASVRIFAVFVACVDARS